MSKLSPYLILFALIALVYHLNPWRPGMSTGAGFDAPLDVTIGTWDTEVVQERKPVLVMFHQPGSAASEKLHSIIEDTRESLAGRFKVTRVDLAANSSLAMRYRIATTPTLLLFKDGIVAATLTKEEFANFPALESKVLAYCEETH